MLEQLTKSYFSRKYKATQGITDALFMSTVVQRTEILAIRVRWTTDRFIIFLILVQLLLNHHKYLCECL